MASSPEARRLTEAHRRAQNRLGAQTVQQMRAVWRLLDFDDLDGSTPNWLRIAVPMVRAQARTSSSLAATYYRNFRAMELGLGAASFTPTLALPPASDAIATSLTVTGPSTVKRATMQGKTADQAMDLGLSRTGKAAMRHALSGGRRTLEGSITSDRSAVGYARVASGSACAFCAMLASRGAVYLSRDAAGSVVGRDGRPRGTRSLGSDYHDGCGCSVEPVYDRNAAPPPGAERYDELWQEAKRMDGDTAKNFRRLVEGSE